MGKGDHRRPGDNAAFRQNFDSIFGMRVVTNEDLPADVIEFRDDRGVVVGRVTGVETTGLRNEGGE